MKVGTRALTAVLTLTLVVSLAACTEGEVRKRDKDRAGSPALLVVDKHGKERWVKVPRATFDQCQVKERYPDCGGNRIGDGGVIDTPNDEGPDYEGRHRDNNPNPRGVPKGIGDCDNPDRVDLVATWIPDQHMKVSYRIQDQRGAVEQKITDRFAGNFHLVRWVCRGSVMLGIYPPGGLPPDYMHCLIRINGRLAKGPRSSQEIRRGVQNDCSVWAHVG